MQVHCPECNTTVSVDENEASEIVNRHNKNRHNGEAVAGIGPKAVPVEEYDESDADPLKVHDMGDDAGPMGNHPDGVRGICKECTLVALFDTEIDANDAVNKHNELAHDGRDEAGTCAWDVPDLPSLEDLPPEVIMEMGGAA